MDLSVKNLNLKIQWELLYSQIQTQIKRFPIIMLYGTEDMTVDYFSNGKLLEEAYSENMNLLTIIPRNFQGHHPHGLLDKSDELAELIITKL